LLRLGQLPDFSFGVGRLDNHAPIVLAEIKALYPRSDWVPSELLTLIDIKRIRVVIPAKGKF
jgi:hypothetical protein